MDDPPCVREPKAVVITLQHGSRLSESEADWATANLNRLNPSVIPDLHDHGDQNPGAEPSLHRV